MGFLSPRLQPAVVPSLGVFSLERRLGFSERPHLQPRQLCEETHAKANQQFARATLLVVVVVVVAAAAGTNRKSWPERLEGI